jgi:hypothetical protein
VLNRDLEHFKETVRRATYRKVPYLILCETLCTLWLFLSDQFLLITQWWYFVLGFVSLALLAILEHDAALPLPFMDQLGSGAFVGAFFLLFAGLFLAEVLGSVAYGFLQSLQLVQPVRSGLTPYLTVASLSVHAGVSEESFKVLLTNLVAKPFRKVFRKKWSKRMDRWIVFVVGTGAVTVWALMHVPYVAAESILGVFLAGMLCLVAVILSRNYLPVVVAHVLYDFLVWLPLASVFSLIA